MIVWERIKQTERVLVTMTWVEDDNLVLPGIVVVLIEGKKLVDSQIWKHAADAIQENVWTTVLILNGNMVNDTLMNVLHELWRMGITGQCVLGILCLGRIVQLFLQLVFQHGRMTQELFLVEKFTKLLKQIQRKYIHIVDRANEIRLELLYLPTDVILLLCRILVDEEVIEQVAAASAEDHARLYREKSLITAFREAGFHTSFISNQQPFLAYFK